MKTTTTILGSLTVLAMMLSASTAWGQTGSYATRHNNNGTAVIYRHASTYEQGVLDGWSNLVRARGDYHYNRSLAEINYQEAYRRHLENSLVRTETYFAMRKANRDARALENGPRMTQEDAVRLSQLKARPRLDANQYRPTLGKLYWPKALLEGKYESLRGSVDHLVANRMAFPQNSTKVQNLAVSMKDMLQQDIREMRPSDYIKAKQFLTGLEREMDFAPIGGVAAR